MDIDKLHQLVRISELEQAANKAEDLFRVAALGDESYASLWMLGRALRWQRRLGMTTSHLTKALVELNGAMSEEDDEDTDPGFIP